MLEKKTIIKKAVTNLRLEFDCLKSYQHNRSLYNEIRNKMVEKIIYLSVLGIIEKRHFIMLQTIISKNT